MCYVTGRDHVHLRPVVAAAGSVLEAVVGVDHAVVSEVDDSSRGLQRASHTETQKLL